MYSNIRLYYMCYDIYLHMQTLHPLYGSSANAMQYSGSCACSCQLTAYCAASQQAQGQDLQEGISCNTAAYHPQTCILTLVPELHNLGILYPWHTL